jgi:hypothetical protein
MDWTDHPRLRVVGTATAYGDRTAPARKRAVSLYADPVAWLVADAVGAALADAGPDARGPESGVLSVSDRGTLHTMDLVRASVIGGRVSPLRFAGANPGSLAGLACIVHRLTGPSMMLSMRPDDARPSAGEIAVAWLTAGACRHVIASEHETGPDGRDTVRTVVLAPRGDGR